MMDVDSFQYSHGHLTVWGTSAAGRPLASHFHPEDDPILEDAVESFRAACGLALERLVFECVPEVPDTPPDLPAASRPCRICDRVTPLNVERGASVYCDEHDPEA